MRKQYEDTEFDSPLKKLDSDFLWKTKQKQDLKNRILTDIELLESQGKHTLAYKKNPRPFVISAVLAATIFISSSFISPTISSVMADVPLLGKIYLSFNDLVGRNLESQKLITTLNETSTSKGIDVSITSAYYDGAIIGVTFNVKGDLKTEKNGNVFGFYEIFDGKEGISDSKEVVYMKPSKNGFVGHIQLSYPKTELPSNTTFPLEFKMVGDKKGSWRFDVPISQLPYETETIDKQIIQENAGVKVKFDSIIVGKASTAINYTATFLIEGKQDQVRLEAYDDTSNEINISQDGIDLETTKEKDKIIVKGRSIIPESLKGKTSYIEVHPKVALSQPDQFVSLNQPTPIEIKANRQRLSVEVENITVKDKSVTVDFQVNNGDKRNWNFMFFKDFARNDITLVKESEKEIYKEPIKHSVETVKKDDLRFRSTFDISKLDDFSQSKYILRVNMGILSANIPVELEKVKIDIN
ncbi:DUF4179 domain-containing protein [Bacillus sp. CECT 9360]|uniref:DUF4179 domain-containing protein n=1 Tax=Bacillus sp. CECT 9360 TaxID=2845821 RepID=UPI001E479142|nr:DUF4179 domain-containing protein [Bacillus sp. CECT 9360]CAH0344640.1 hypothetical protein BCI9360_00900 [Bacillus sp. CECT 9360]